MKKILIIEDTPEVRDNTAELLALANYKVFTANDGKAGVLSALQEKPDLVICDITMPELDGFGVLHALQKNASTKNIPFIFLTAKVDRADFRRGMEMGADDYITKPFSGTELLNAVEGRLKKAEQVKEELTSAPADAALHGNVKDILEQLTSGRNINRYKNKQIIFMEGNRPTCLYQLKKGKVKAYKTNEDGKGLVTDLYSEGDFLGYVALLENTNYKETAEAIETAELAIIPKEDFDAVINNNPEVSKKFIQLLAKNISEKEKQLLGLAYNSLRKKVAIALLAVYHKYNDAKKEVFSIDISRENLAALAGTATESLIRTLTDFKNEKLIELKGGLITIVNENKLAKI
ncbi:MAG TPA: response regulator [Chitinophagaceae bacterium]|nr:response regulator [Chitinophagaceae bacterium]